MNGAAAIGVMLAASLCVGIGLARLGAWLIARRERDATAAIRDAAFAARASAEVRRG